MKLSGLALFAGFCCLTLSVFAQDAKDTSKSAAAKNLLPDPTEVSSWRFEEHESAKGSISVEGTAPEDRAIVFDVKEITGTDWHVQAVITNLDLKDGTEYKVSFEAKADARRTAQLNLGIDQEDWHMIGLQEELYLGKDFKKQSFTFRADSTAPKKNRLCFALGTDKGKVYIKNLTLTEVTNK